MWSGNAGCTLFGCTYLPSAANCLAVCGPKNQLLMYDTASSTLHCISSLQAQDPMQPRQLLCVAAAQDGTSLAVSGRPFVALTTAILPIAC